MGRAQTNTFRKLDLSALARNLHVFLMAGCRQDGKLMETLWQDLKFGWRVLRKSPGFAAMAILVLTLGIGANTAIFSVVNTVLLRPLPLVEPDRLVHVWHTPPQASFPGISIFSVSPANFLDWRSQNHVFEGLATSRYSRYTLTGTGRPEALWAVAVSEDYFPIMRVQPLLGRLSWRVKTSLDTIM